MKPRCVVKFAVVTIFTTETSSNVKKIKPRAVYDNEVP